VPDTTSLEMPGSSGSSGGVPSWLIVVGAVAGVVGVVMLLKGSGGGGGTTAAGTSINAALGSIQEENMNLLGTTQAGFMQTSNQLTAGFTGLSGQVTSASQQEAADAANTQALISGGFTNLQGGITQLGTQMTGLSSQVQGYQQLNAASFQGINQTLTSLTQLEQTGQTNSAQYAQNLGSLMNELSSENLQTQNWVDEIKARLQSGNYSQAENGPSGQGWQSPGQGFSPLTQWSPIPMNSAQVGTN